MHYTTGEIYNFAVAHFLHIAQRPTLPEPGFCSLTDHHNHNIVRCNLTRYSVCILCFILFCMHLARSRYSQYRQARLSRTRSSL